MNILVIEDELHVAAALMLALGKTHRVDAAAGSAEAYELLKDNRRGFDLVVTDHRMPECTGLELIQKLQGSAYRGKYIVVSGYLSPQLEAGYQKLGVEYMMPKPFDVLQLRKAVAASIEAIEDRRN